MSTSNFSWVNQTEVHVIDDDIIHANLAEINFLPIGWLYVYIYIYHQSQLKKGTRNNHWYTCMKKKLIPWVWLTVYCQGFHQDDMKPSTVPNSRPPGSWAKTPNRDPWRICIGRDDCIFTYTDVSENSGFSPQIIHFNKVFHYKPSILGYPYFWKHPYMKTHQKINYIHVGKYTVVPSHRYMSWMSLFF